MNVDFLTLSSAVQQANNVALSETKTADVAPRKIPTRRRSTTSSNALQFLEAAHRSWTFAQEDLPSGETTALQRRKSNRSTHKKEVLSEVGHKSFSVGEHESALLKVASSKALPPRRNTTGSSKKMARRASICGSVVTIEEPVQEEKREDASVRTGGRLARRSSMQCSSNKLDEKKSKKPMRRLRSDPQELEKRKRPKGKMARRNTIDHCSSLEDSATSLAKPCKSSMSNKTGQKPAKGSVRFELDHKGRIKRRVHCIRAQNSKTGSRALWWSEEELDAIYERENKVYEKFADNRSYKRKIRRLWGNCSKASGSASKPLSPEAVAHVAGSPSRGLEVDILETVRDRRARVIGSLLDAQETLRDFDPAIRTKALSARYKNLCKAATRFARKMAEGDALEAANVYSN